MVYSKRKVSPLHEIRRRTEVYKYGISAGVTRGGLGFNGTLVKTSELSVNNQPYEYRLHNQIEVLRLGDKCFALPGDSGALVSLTMLKMIRWLLVLLKEDILIIESYM